MAGGATEPVARTRAKSEGAEVAVVSGGPRRIRKKETASAARASTVPAQQPGRRRQARQRSSRRHGDY